MKNIPIEKLEQYEEAVNVAIQLIGDNEVSDTLDELSKKIGELISQKEWLETSASYECIHDLILTDQENNNRPYTDTTPVGKGSFWMPQKPITAEEDSVCLYDISDSPELSGSFIEISRSNFKKHFKRLNQ